MRIGQLGKVFQGSRHGSFVFGAAPTSEVVRRKHHVGAPGGYLPHPGNFLRLAPAAQGDWDA